MSKIKINEQLFLGSIEVDRISSFLSESDKNQLRYNVSSFGLLNLLNDSGFQNMKVISGSNAESISLNKGYALDNLSQFITVPEDNIDVLDIATDNVWNYISIAYDKSNLEEGTVSVSPSGVLTGVNTSFIKVLRGQPNFPSRISFPNSSLNTNNYEVVTINSDNELILAGVLQAENDMQYANVGTFTRDKPVPTSSELIFEFDYFALTASLSDVSNNETSFLLARVKTNGASMVIEDLRSTFLTTVDEHKLSNIDDSENPLIGIESIRIDSTHSPKSKNLVKVGWGFRASAWTIDLANSTINISFGNGGIFKESSDFSDDSFNGWRCYFSDGSYDIIDTSVKQSSNISLSLRNTDTSKFITAVLNGDLVIVPDSDNITLIFQGSPYVKEEVFYLPNNLGFTEVDVSFNATSTTCSYAFSKSITSSIVRTIKDGTYLNENSFDSNGDFSSEVLSNCTSGVFTMLLSADNHSISKANLNADNRFAEKNVFAKRVDFGYSNTLLDIISSTNGRTVVEVLDGGNFFKLADTNTLSEIQGFKYINPNEEASSPWMTIEVRADVVIKHNYTFDAEETTDGMTKFFMQNGTDVNLTVGDFFTVALYLTSWNIINIFRKGEVLDSTQISEFPLNDLDSKCFVFPDNKLGTILQELINNFCSMNSATTYGFLAQRTLNEGKFDNTPYNLYFDDDITAPLYDNGNDFYGDSYIAPNDDLPEMKFIAENLNFHNTSLSVDATVITVRILKNGSVELASKVISIAWGTPTRLNSLVTDYVQLIEGDIITVTAVGASGSVVIDFLSGGRFSNSFK